MHLLQGTTDGSELSVAVVYARFHKAITDGLLTGAQAALAEMGVSEDAVLVVAVPGALELAVAAQRLAGSARFDAVIVLGAVIQGETDHYDFVCAQTTRSCAAVADETGVPVGFGLLTCPTLAHAVARSSDDAKNKGREAVAAAIETANLLGQIDTLLELSDQTLDEYTEDDDDSEATL